MKKTTLLGLGAAAVAAGLVFSCNQDLLPILHPEQKPKSGQRRIACVGDSITYGCGVKGWFRNNYPVVLGRLLGKGYCVNNYGYSARTASLAGDFPYMKERIYRKSLAFLPDTVLIMLGANDSKPQNWRGAAAYTEDLRKLLRSYQALPSAPEVWLLAPPPAWDNRYEIDGGIIGSELRQALKALAETEKTGFIDIWTVFENKPDLFPDGVHPNAAGAELLAKSVYMHILQGRNQK